MVGECIGNYRIVQRLGEGGMATVYLATHPALGRRVAVKVLNPDLARLDQMVGRFFDEARAASAIGHRGIVEVFDLGTLATGAPYIVMEFLDGENLADRIARTGPLSLEAAADIAGQTATVLEAAHARSIVHRDLKPDNLFLVPDSLRPGRELVKLLDFGIAKLAQRPPHAADQRTRTGVILGTPRYMSPEQCRESRDVDHRTDVYSLGIVLYEMLAGSPPFAASSWGELAHMHIGVIPPPLQTQRPDLPASVARVVHRALEKDPAARFQSMEELRRALEAALAEPAAFSPGAASPHAEGGGTVDAPPAARALGAGSTMRLDEAPPAQVPRRTTLAGAASEVLRDREQRASAIRVVPVLVVAAAAAVVAIVGSLALRRTPPAAPAPAAVAPPRPVLPPPAVVQPPPPEQPEPPSQPPEAGPATPPAPPDPAPAKPVRRRRQSPAPAKPSFAKPSPAKPSPSRPVPIDRPPEPEKI